jgi:hypothetical protein
MIPALIVPVVAIVIPFVFVGFIVGMKFFNDLKARELHHETIRRALEKGQTLPPELLNMRDSAAIKPKSNDRRAGLILIAVGAGLFFFFGGVTDFGGIHGGTGMRWVGLIPGLIGVALLINWALERNDKKDGET